MSNEEKNDRQPRKVRETRTPLRGPQPPAKGSQAKGGQAEGYTERQFLADLEKAAPELEAMAGDALREHRARKTEPFAPAPNVSAVLSLLTSWEESCPADADADLLYAELNANRTYRKL